MAAQTVNDLTHALNKLHDPALPSKPTKHNMCEQSHQLQYCKTCRFQATALRNPQMARLLAFQAIQSLM
jgi:hypothetical protein